MCKSLLPHVSDGIAHAFFYAQHMATVHYEHGKLHVHKEVMDNAKKEASQKELPSSKKDTAASDHTCFTWQETPPVPIFTKQYDHTVSTLCYNYLPGDHLPPRT